MTATLMQKRSTMKHNPLSHKALANLIYIGKVGSLMRWDGCAFEETFPGDQVSMTHLEAHFLVKRGLVEITVFPGKRDRLIYTLSTKGKYIYEVMK
jgi:hypothetical protein